MWLIALWLGMLLVPCAHAADAASTLVFEPQRLDLGSVLEGRVVHVELRIRNIGSDMAEIATLTASCGCTRVEAESRLLMPGQFTRVQVTIDTTLKRGRTKKWIELSDGQGRKARAVLALHVRPNPHLSGAKGLFDGRCRRCHFDPAQGERRGAALYQAVCAMCHGPRGEGRYAPRLVGHHDRKWLRARVALGTGSRYMPGFSRKVGGPLDDAQLDSLVAWILKLDSARADR